MIALLFIIIALGIILEIASLKRDPEKVEIDTVISPQCNEPGAPFKVQTTIANKSRLPISYLAIRVVYPLLTQLPDSMKYSTRDNGLHAQIICMVKGRQRKKLMYEVSIEKRGVHLIGENSIEFGDFLGFRELSKKVHYRQEIVVYPKRLVDSGLADTLGSFCGDIAAKRILIRDPILTIGSREYTGREPMKEIHWPQSAHRGQLMVREFEYNRQISVCVVLSVEGISYVNNDEIDRCCEVARTTCETLVEKGVLVKFFTNSRLRSKEEISVWKCEVTSGRTGSLLETLGRVTNYANCSLEGLLESMCHESSHDTSYLIILPKNDKNGEEAADRLRKNTGQEVLILRSEQYYYPDHEIRIASAAGVENKA
ncbi:MAG: DUF58 domain-containing protein [Oscillospiraceae bacterium]|nr:DUF58 domain-containing protein [Oscillospiraceae bacterium]